MGQFKENKDEIIFHLINSMIAGALVFLGSLVGTGGEITYTGLLASIFISLLTIVTKFKDYWSSQEGEYTRKKHLLSFI
jgi:hypothetical protein